MDLRSPLLVLLLVACDERDRPDGEPPAHQRPETYEVAATTPPATVASAADPTVVAMTDQLFIDLMVPHRQAGIEMAELAAGQADHDELRALGRTIAAQQKREAASLRAWRKVWFGSDEVLPLEKLEEQGPLPVSEAMRTTPGTIALLRNAEPFDLAFIDAMIPHHEDAVLLARAAALDAQNEEIRAMADEMIRDQQAELTRLRAWRQQWYPEAPPRTSRR